ncbi:MAG TPA: fatty acid--CoA ligase family protein [Acidimicrobiales bacterium]
MPELVALDLPGGAGFVDALQAVWDTGDAAAPLDPRLPLAARALMLEALRPSRIVSSDGDQHRVEDGLPVEEGDALVVATSGTSGEPKGVVLTHDAVAASAQATSTRLGVDPGRHTWLACLPLAHIGGLSVVTRAVLSKTPLIVMPGFDADQVEQVGRSGRATHVSLVSTALRHLDASVFTCVLLGGSKVPPDLPPNVVSTYGMTETGSGVVYDGTALDGVEIAVRGIGEDSPPATGPDDDGAEGELLIRCPMLFRSYRDGADGRVAGPDGRGDWFATGDAGRLTTEGSLIVSGRIEDVITTGAEKVWPDVVERVLTAHPGVAEVAVWKRTDPEWGERVVAWVVPADDATPSLEQLRDMVAETLAPWAAPKQLVIVDDLPRTAAGKVRRRELDKGAS